MSVNSSKRVKIYSKLYGRYKENVNIQVRLFSESTVSINTVMVGTYIYNLITGHRKPEGIIMSFNACCWASH